MSDLVEKAEAVARNAYAPYSNYLVGAALMGSRKGDKVTVQAPAGSVTYTVVSVG